MEKNIMQIPKEAKQAPLEWQPPMLATLTYNYFSDTNWLYECKMDGERCLAYSDDKGSITLYSRNKQVLNNIYPELVKALKNSNSKSFIIDGEIVTFDKRGITNFSKLQSRLQLKNPTADEIRNTPVYYCVFDLIYLEGYDLKEVPLIERKVLLENNIAFNKLILFTKHYMRYGLKYHEYVCKKGLEGLIAKNAYSTYQNKRSKDWLKFKCSNQQEFVIIGYTEPKRTRVGLGALLLGYYDQGHLLYAGKVGTGFDRKLLNFLKSKLSPIEIENPPTKEYIKEGATHWVQPIFVCEVGFTEWTLDHKLRHPRYLGLRTDKDAKEVVRE